MSLLQARYNSTRPGDRQCSSAESLCHLKEVPGNVCGCGEYFLSSEVTGQLLHRAEEAVHEGTAVAIRRFRSTAGKSPPLPGRACSGDRERGPGDEGRDTICSTASLGALNDRSHPRQQLPDRGEGRRRRHGGRVPRGRPHADRDVRSRRSGPSWRGSRKIVERFLSETRLLARVEPPEHRAEPDELQLLPGRRRPLPRHGVRCAAGAAPAFWRARGAVPWDQAVRLLSSAWRGIEVAHAGRGSSTATSSPDNI